MRSLGAGGVTAVVCGVVASGALAGPATYYASPTSTDTSGSCSASAPCRLDQAVALAGPGDVVVVLPGTYSITYPVETTVSATIEGQPGEPRPSLVGDPSLTSDTLEVSGGAVVRHLEIETQNDTGLGTAALSIEGGTAEDLVLLAGASDNGGEALSAKDTTGGTTVRTVLARSQAPNGEAVSFKDSKTTPGTVYAYNLTAIGDAVNAEAISSNAATGTVWVKDSIASGQGSDVEIKPGTQPVNLTYSDFRPLASSGYVDQGGNVLAAPTFVDPGAGNYREAEASPTIDAGAADTALSASDLDGNPRVLGSAPDMGAYEYTGAGAGEGTGGSDSPLDETTDQLPPPSAPVPGVSVALQRVSGTVRVQLPGHHRFLRLKRGTAVPVGSIVDVTQGRVILTSAVNRSGARKSGLFRGSRFVVTQATGAHATTNLRLVGGSFAGCSRLGAAADRTGPLATIARHRRRVVRRLWGTDSGGNFVTIGNTASATVRGTAWLTEDLCDGTLVRVFRGRVLVYDDMLRRNVPVGRGHSYFARAAR